MHHRTEKIAYIMAFVTPVVEDWLEQMQYERIKGNQNQNISIYLFSYLTTQAIYYPDYALHIVI